MWPGYTFLGDLRTDGHPFKPETAWPELRVLLDPATQVDEDVAAYLKMLKGKTTGTRVFTEMTPPSADADAFRILDERRDGSGAVILHGKPTGRMYGMFSVDKNIQRAYNWAAAGGFDPDAAKRRQIYVEAAIALNADLLVTDNDFVLAKPHRRCVYAVNPNDAMTIIGLHQRLQGFQIISDEFLAGTIGRWQAEHTEAWALLRTLRELFDRKPQGDGSWLDLIRACGERLKRVLRVRDMLLAGSIHPGGSGLFGSPEVLLEQIALNLSGMLDAFGRAMNIVLNLGAAPQYCSLGNDRFAKRLPPSARAVIRNCRCRGVLSLLNAIRNTIHHEDLHAAGEGNANGRTIAELVAVDDDTAQTVREVANMLDRGDAWIAHDHPKMGLMIRGVPFVEDLIEYCVGIINELATTLPWPGEYRPHADESEGDPSDWSRYGPTVDVINRLYGIHPQLSRSLPATTNSACERT